MKARLISALPIPANWPQRGDLPEPVAREAIEEILAANSTPRHVRQVLRLVRAADLEITASMVNRLLMGMIDDGYEWPPKVAEGIEKLLEYPRLEPRVHQLFYELINDHIDKASIMAQKEQELSRMIVRDMYNMLQHPEIPEGVLQKIVHDAVGDGLGIPDIQRTPYKKLYKIILNQPELWEKEEIREPMRQQAHQFFQLWGELAQHQCSDQVFCLEEMGADSPDYLAGWLRKHPDKWDRDTLQELLQSEYGSVRTVALRLAGRAGQEANDRTL